MYFGGVLCRDLPFGRPSRAHVSGGLWERDVGVLGFRSTKPSLKATNRWITADATLLPHPQPAFDCWVTRRAGDRLTRGGDLDETDYSRVAQSHYRSRTGKSGPLPFSGDSISAVAINRTALYSTHTDSDAAATPLKTNITETDRTGTICMPNLYHRCFGTLIRWKCNSGGGFSPW